MAAVRHQRDLISPESCGQTARVCANRPAYDVRRPDGTATAFPLYSWWRTSTIAGSMSVSCRYCSLIPGLGVGRWRFTRNPCKQGTSRRVR